MTIRTTCGACGIGCGMIAHDEGDGRVEITGDIRHPANRGQLCAVGLGLSDMPDGDERLLHPVIAGRRASWERALAHVARRLKDITAKHKPGSVAFLLGRDLLNEDYYLANKLLKGFIGSTHICMPSAPGLDTNARRLAGQLGEDVTPASRDDIDLADLILLFGGGRPILRERIEEARHLRDARVAVVVETNQPMSAVEADLHLPVAPGTTVALIRGLIAHCRRAGAIDEQFLRNHVAGGDRLLVPEEGADDLWSTARTCALPPARLQHFFDLFATAARTLTLFEEDAEAGALTAAILDLHLATGRLGRAGMGPMPLSAAPSAAGCRETGALTSFLAGHADFGEINHQRLARFWGTNRLAHQPVEDISTLTACVATGEVQAIWAIGCSDAPGVGDLLSRCSFAILSESAAHTPANAAAHVLLPAHRWGERDGTRTALDRLVSRERPFLTPAGETRPHWWALTRAGRLMGWPDAFYFDRPADIFREHARLTAYLADGRNVLDLHGFAAMSNPAYAGMTPWRWGATPFVGGRFASRDGKAVLSDAAFGNMPGAVTDNPKEAAPVMAGNNHLRHKDGHG